MSSLSDSIFKAIDDIMNDFINKVSEKKNIPAQELLDIWNNKPIEKNLVKEENKKETVVEDIKSLEKNIDQIALSKLSNAELKTRCKAKGLIQSGTKEKLVERLLQAESQPKISVTQTNPVESVVIKKLTANIPIIPIEKNKFGNHEHQETGFIFDKKSKKVIGKQNKDGNIDKLSHDDIDLLNKYKFDYVIPENLGVKVERDEEIESDSEDEDGEELDEEIVDNSEVEGELSEEDDDDDNEEVEDELEELQDDDGADDVEYDDDY